MMDSSVVAKIVSASRDGRIVGRIRIQKIFYLLEQLGLNSGLSFSYHHYGPYSEDLTSALFFAEFAEDLISEKQEFTASGNPYSIFELRPNAAFDDEGIGELNKDTLAELVGLLERPTSVVIELAATIHWLINKEKVENWEAELKVRKVGKATDENITKAIKILKQINLFD